MTFIPGQSGNPNGRPKGSVNKQLKLLREAAEEVLPLILERALAGDFDAQKLILERGIPRMKPVAHTEEFTLPEGSLAEQMQSLLQQVADGELSVQAAVQAMGLVAAAAKAKEVEEQESAAAARRAALAAPDTEVGMYLAKLQERLVPSDK